MGDESTQTTELLSGLVTTTATQKLRQFLEEGTNADKLLNIIRFYLYKANFVSNQALAEMALEVLSEVVAAALKNAERYDSVRSPMAWLLGIANNIVKQKRDHHYRLKREEPVSRIQFDSTVGSISPSELFDHLATLDPRVFEAIAMGDLESGLAKRQPLIAALARLSATDREVLKLDILHELDGEELARELGVTPGAARVRKHRALERLRQAYREEGGER